MSSQNKKDQEENAMLADALYQFQKGLMSISEKLESRIPFQSLTIGKLGLNKDDPHRSSATRGKKGGDSPSTGEQMPLGLMADCDYNYCYKSLLIETKEWWTTINNVIAYMQKSPSKQVEKEPEKEKKKP